MKLARRLAGHDVWTQFVEPMDPCILFHDEWLGMHIEVVAQDDVIYGVFRHEVCEGVFDLDSCSLTVEEFINHYWNQS